VEGPAGSPLVGIFALRYPSGLAGPSEVSALSSGQQSTTTVDVGVGMTAPPPAATQLQAASQRPPTPATPTGLTIIIIRMRT